MSTSICFHDIKLLRYYKIQKSKIAGLSGSVFFLTLLFICKYIAKLKHTKKNDDFIFMFILVRTTTKSIQFIKKSVFLFFFSCCCFGFFGKAATIKNRQLIFDLSMLSLGLGLLFIILNQNLKLWK
jgi:hypothetical protein